MRGLWLGEETDMASYLQSHLNNASIAMVAKCKQLLTLSAAENNIEVELAINFIYTSKPLI